MEFSTMECQLSDNSVVFDVRVSDSQTWPAPTEHTAEITAQVLNEVLEGFQLCGSERQVNALSAALRVALAKTLDQ